LIVFKGADEVLHGIAALVQAIEGAIADQIHRQEAASLLGGSVGEDYRSGHHIRIFLDQILRFQYQILGFFPIPNR
jgi:hypothetical protein